MLARVDDVRVRGEVVPGGGGAEEAGVPVLRLLVDHFRKVY